MRDRKLLDLVLILLIPTLAVLLFAHDRDDTRPATGPTASATESRVLIAPTQTAEARRVATVTAERAEYERKGFHCLDAWDGNHNGLEALVRDVLNDPGSMETYETRVSPVEDGEHSIIMEFGARNVFGGMVRQTAFGTYDHKTCEAVLLGIQ